MSSRQFPRRHRWRQNKYENVLNRNLCLLRLKTAILTEMPASEELKEDGTELRPATFDSEQKSSPSEQIRFVHKDYTSKTLILRSLRNFSLAAMAFLSLAVIFQETTPYMTAASLTYFLLVAGVINRKKRRTHLRLMLTAISIDISLVLVLELQRAAIKTALDMKLGFFQQLHIASSLLAVLFYFPTMYFGWKAFRDHSKNIPVTSNRHIWLGITAFILRSIGFITMFSMLHHLTND
ncbi:MAG: hypothetical protein JWQ35_366 [Bacteriovoracaceae bacterium]|nr:hypothetical protein [Bacteriovoracaceae bacterium]